MGRSEAGNTRELKHLILSQNYASEVFRKGKQNGSFLLVDDHSISGQRPRLFKCLIALSSDFPTLIQIPDNQNWAESSSPLALRGASG